MYYIETLEERLMMAGDSPFVANVVAQPGMITLNVQDDDLSGLEFNSVFDIANYTLLGSGGDGTFDDGNDVDVSSRINFTFLDNDGSGNEAIVVILNNISDDGERYQLRVNNIADIDGNALVYPVPAEFDSGELANIPRVDGTDAGRDFYRVSTVSQGGMDPAAAQNLGNYTLIASGNDFSFSDGNETDRSDLLANAELVFNFIDQGVTSEFIQFTLAGVPDDGEQYQLLIGGNVVDVNGDPLIDTGVLEFNSDDVIRDEPPVVTGANGSPGTIRLFVDDADGAALDSSLVNDLANYILLASGGDGTFGEANDIDRSDLINSAFIQNSEGVSEDIVIDLRGVLPDGERYRLIVNNIADSDGNALVVGAPAEFDAQEISDVPVVTAVATSIGQVALTVVDPDFNQLAVTLAQDIANYSLIASGGDGTFGEANDVDRSDLLAGAVVEFVSFNATGTVERLRVLLNTVPSDGERYQLRLSNITDNSGAPLYQAAPIEFNAADVALPLADPPKALQFDGNGDFVTTTLNIDQSSGSAGVTFEAWVFPTSTSSGRHHVISTNNGGSDWSLLRDGATWQVFNGSGAVSTGFAVELNTWQHLAVVFKPGVGIDFYKNGQKVTLASIGFDTNDANVNFGRNPQTSEYFAGIIDEVRVWSGQRTEAEILAAMNSPLTGNEPNLAGYWPLDEGAGATTVDYSGNANHGTLNNAMGNDLPQQTANSVFATDITAATWISDVGGNWEDAANWSGGFVPGSIQNVVINKPGVVVTINSAATVKSISSTSDIAIAATRSLTVSADSDITGGLSLGAGASLTASGAGTLLEITGTASVNGGRLFATGGATLSLPNVAGDTIDFGSSAMTIRATGAGSQILLPGVTTLTLSQERTSVIEALLGGRVDLGGLTDVNIAVGGFDFQTRNIDFKADGAGSEIDLTSLVNFNDLGPGRSLIQATNGGTLTTPALVNAKGMRLVVDATGNVDVDQVVNLDGSRIEITGQPLDLSGATSFVSGELLLQGGGTATLDNLSNVTGASFTVKGGVTLTLPAVTAVSFSRPDANPTFSAEGAGSILSLPNVTVLSLDRERTATVTALAGGVVDLSAVAQVNIAAGGFDFQTRNINFTADGVGSRINLSALTAFNDLGPGRSVLTAKNAGEIRVPLLTTAHRISVPVDGTGILSTSQITNAFGSRFEATNAAIDLGNATTIADGEIVLNAGGSIDLAGVTNINGASLFANAGAVIELPLASTVTFNSANDGTPIWRATGAGSRIDVSNVTQLALSTIRSITIDALAGGEIDLSGVTLIDIEPGGFSFQLRDINFKADGAGSLIDLSALTNFNDEGPGRSTLNAVNAGEIRVPNMATVRNVNFPIDGTGILSTAQITSSFGTRFVITGTDVDVHQTTTLQEGEIVLNAGGVIDLSAVTNIDGANLFTNGGAQLALPSVTSVDFDNALGQPIWRASGAGSAIDASSVTQFVMSTERTGTIDALAGGRIDLSGMTLIDIDPGGFEFQTRNINFKSDGANSVIDLSALSLFNDEGPGRSILIASNGGVILLSDPLPTLVGADIQFDGVFATGPSVISHTVHVGEAGQLPFIDFTFSEEVNSSTFTVDDVVITGPGGSVAVASVERTDLSNLHYRVRLANQALVAGAYRMTIGPNIRDFAGNTMNQNGNTANGEAGDSFTVNFNVNLPNLTVTPVSLSLSSADFGQTLDVTWTVTNTGNEPTTGSWLDRVYLSADTNIGSGDLLLHTFNAPPAPLNPGESYTITRQVTIPFAGSLTAGTYFIGVRTDDTGQLSELSELDNTASQSISIAVPVLPDLTITPVSAPTAATSGSQVELQWTTANIGTAATATGFVERIYLSTDGTISSGDTLLFERTVPAPFAAGASLPSSALVTIPIDRFGDNMQFIFVVDALDAIEEFTNEGNNIATSEVDVALGLIADLKATVTSAPTFVVGDPATITINWLVENVGSGVGVNLSWRDAVILSADAIAGNFDDFVLGRFDNPQSLASGGSYSQSRSFTLPTDFTGQYHVFVVTDEARVVFENGAEANNTDEADAIFEVMPIPYADLVVSNISAPATVGSGQTMTVLFTVTNQGIGLTSKQNWQDRLFLATDAAGTNRIAEFKLDHIGPIAAGNNYLRGAQVAVPNGYSGALFVVVQAAAQGGPFEFTFGGNNTAVSSAINVTLSPSPDLTVSSITSPASTQDGEAIDVTWTVTNQGAIGAAGTWEDLLFLQLEGDPDAPVVPLGAFSFTGPLSVGASYTRTERIIVPNTTSGTYRVVVAANHDGRVFEDNTANNPVPDDALIAVTLRPRADLAVQQVIAPADVDAGSTLALEFIVANLGTLGTTPSKWKDIVYLSLDNQISNDDILIGNFDNSAALLPGENYLTSTGSIVVPQRFRGSMFILVKPDHTNLVDEFPNENNLFAQPIFVNPLPLADLVVSDVIIPTQATAAATIDVTFSLDNLGSGPTNIGQYLGQIWLTIDKNRPNPQAGDYLLKTFAIDAPLGVNQGIDLTHTVTLPANLPSGVYHITPWIDPVNAVLEDTLAINVNPDDPDEIDGNNFKAKAIDIVGVEPDLEVTQITAPTTAVGGDLISISYTVSNPSTGVARGRWVDRVYLTNMANPLDPAARSILLAEHFHETPVGAGQSYTQTVNLVLSPSATGQFFAVVTDAEQLLVEDDFNVVDEVFEDNNTTAVTTSVTPILADLVITNVEVSPNLQSGESMTIRYTVTNQGEHAIWSGTDYWQDFIWIGRGEEFDRIRASFLGAHVQAAPASLAPGESYIAEFTAKLPKGLDGDYHVYIHLDAHNDRSPLFDPLTCRILETAWFPGDNGSNDVLLDDFRRWAYEDPRNNLRSEPVTVEFFEPNLVIEAVDVQSPPLSGEIVQIQYTVSNLGNRATRTSKFTDRFFLSRDASLDSADLFLGEFPRAAALAAGDSYTSDVSFRLPEGVEGDFFILGFTDAFAERDDFGLVKSDIGFNLNGVKLSFDADFIPFDMVDLTRRDLSRGEVFEFQNEGDNILAQPLTIALSPAPDLQVTNIIAPASVLTGQLFDVTFTVANLGTAPVPASEKEWNNMVFLSRDGLLDIKADKFLKEIERNGVLNPGDSFDITLRVQAPRDFVGEFNLFAATDPIRSNSVIGNVFEGTSERNNDRFVTIQIDQPPATDMVVDAIRFDPATVQTGEPIHVEWDVRNTSGDTASGQWGDAVYLSLDESWDINDRPMGVATFTGSVAPGASYTLSLNAFLPPVTPGPYFIIVRNDIFNQVFEGPEVSVGELNNAAASTETLAVTVQEIQLGIAHSTTLSSGQDRLLAVQVPAGETLRVTLRSSSGQSVHELFLRQDAAPTSASFDADYEGGLSANLISILPSTEDGIVYILIRGQSEPGPNTPVNVIAELLPLSITNVKTDTGGDSAFVTATISGAKFDPGAVVTLTRPGFAEISPVNFQVIDGTKIIAAFDFTGKPRGLYDVKVTNPDGSFAVVPYRFLVERAIEADVTVGVGGPRFILAGDVGTYSVAVQGTSNVDTPYVFFQVGIPEMGINEFVYNLDYLNFFSNVRGSSPDADLDGVPFPSLNPAINTNGYLLTSGYLYDQHAFGFDGFTFNIETYPGLKELNERNFEQLRERIYATNPAFAEAGILDNGPQGLDLIQPGLFALYKKFGAVPDFFTQAFVPFQFNVVVAATAMTRAEFFAHSLGEAEQLRQGVLDDVDASAGLLALAADKPTWDALFLASLEEAGVLRPEGDAPPIREHAVIQSLMSLLATGALLGPAGSDLLGGDIISFFESLRLQYGHNETLEAPTEGIHPTSGNKIPVLPTFDQFDLGLTAQTQFIAFNVYAPWVPFEDRGLGLPADFQFTGITFEDPSELANLDLRRFLTGGAAETGIASITGPFSAESNGFLPVDAALPYTINFQNDPSASSFVNEIRIVADIDQQLDTRTFRLGDLRIGDINIDVPSDRGVYTADIDFLDTKGFILRVSTGVDLAANEATWLIQAIDPITGQLITDPNRGLLPPNNALGDGFGFVSYTIRTEDDVVTGDEVAASARVFFDNAAPEDTEVLTQLIDAASPVTQLTVTRITPAAPNFLVNWSSLDDTDGSGFKHVTIYVAEDGGDFAIWQRRVTEATGSAVFTGTPSHTYEFLALATDNAGNREEPPLGLLAPNDGSGLNLGGLTDLEGTLPDFGIAPTPSPAPSTNPLFTAAELGDASAVPPVLAPEFDVVSRPFAGRAFATGIAQSHASIGAMAIVEAPDGSFIISGGASRNELYRLSEDGGAVGEPIATLEFPIFNLAFDSQGRLWATTGGGPLLQLDPISGAILDQFGEGLTIALAVDPGTDRIFVSSNGGVDVFDPATQTFTRFSRDKDLRVGSLAFSPEGELFAVTWPGRQSVVKFNERRRVETVLTFDSLIDSISFGVEGTRLEGLLFVSHNTGSLSSTGAVEPDTSELTMVDMATLRTVAVAQGGSRGDVVRTTSDGRILISQSNQVDVLKPAERPLVLTVDPSDGEVVDASLTTITIAFSEDMFTGTGSEAASVLNAANYAISGQATGAVTISDVAYDINTRTVTLTIAGLAADDFTLTIDDALTSIDHLSLLQPVVTTFSVATVNLAPRSLNDQVVTVEDTPIIFSVLLNDSDENNDINPTSVLITQQPLHGSLSINNATGQITYTPAANYSGPDEFRYTVSDLAGQSSNESTVRLSVSAVADVPTLIALAASGNQDTAIPLTITANLTDTDGSESLTIQISGVPAGALLSAGSLIGPGIYQLTPQQLPGLTLTPPLGSSADFTLFVTATSTEASNGNSASDTVVLPVEVIAANVGPLAVAQFTVNGGNPQRSTIHDVAVRFNQHVVIADVTQRVRLIARKTNTVIALAADRFNYNAATFTLSINLDGLTLPDDHYLIRLTTDAITSAAARNVHLSDTDLSPVDGMVDLEFHKLEADWDGNDVVNTLDNNLLNLHYNSRVGQPKYDADFDLVSIGTIDQNDYAVWRRALNRTSDKYGPNVLLNLANDTGRSNTDRITFDATISGAVRDTGALGIISAGVDGAATFNISSFITASGAFTLTLANLQTIRGSTLADGVHTLNLIARDARGNVTNSSLAFTLDRQGPAAPAMPDLLAAFDTGASSTDNLTKLSSVSVRAASEANALVRLAVDGVNTAPQLGAGPHDFALNLSEGTRTIRAQAEDLAGNLSGLSPILSIIVDKTAPAIPSFSTAPVGGETTTITGQTEANARVDLVELGLTTTAAADGSYSFANIPLVLGLSKFTVNATDAAGNVSTFAGAIRRLGAEQDAPVIIAGLANDTGLSASDFITTDPTITGSVIDPSSTPIAVLLASLNGAPSIDVLSALSGSFFTVTPAMLDLLNGSALADGTHTLSLRAEDAFLNSSTVTTISFTLDRTVPPAPGTPDLAPDSDLGDGDDNLTGDTTPTIEITGEEGATIVLIIDDVPVGSTTVTDGIATFTPGPLTDGDHTITAKTISPSGVPSGAAAPLIITIDTAGPSQPTLILDPTFDTNPTGDDSTSLEVVTLIGSTDANLLVQLFRGSDLSVPIAQTTSNGSGAFSFANVALAIGTNAFTAAVVDGAGNSRTVSRSITSTAADTRAPIVLAKLKSDTGRSASDAITFDQTLTGAIDDASAITAFTAAIDGKPAVSMLSRLAGGVFTLSKADLNTLFGATLPDGVHTVTLRATDAGGLQSAPVNVTFTLDTLRPNRPATPDLIAASDTGQSRTDNITNAAIVSLLAGAESNAILRLFVEGALTDEATLSGAQTTFNLGNLAQGIARISTRAEDIAGNQSLFSNLLLLTIDRTAPTAPAFGLDESSNTRPFGDNETAFENVRLVGTTDADAIVKLVNTGAEQAVEADGAFAFKRISLPALGDHAFTVIATDVAGNTTTSQQTIKRVSFVATDLLRPEVTLTASNTTNTVGGAVTFTLTAADNVGIVTRELTINGQSVAVAPDGTATFTPSGPGFFTAVATAKDAAGNEGQVSVEFSFFLDPVLSGDTTAPIALINDAAITGFVTGIANLTGTASDANILRYTLAVSPKGLDAFEVYSTGTASVSNGILGPFDPTVLENGYYDVRLTVIDTSGNTSTSTRTLRAEGQTKVGNFTVAFVDAAIPAAGLPLQATRLYDSRARFESGDFGFGWDLDVDSMKVSAANVLGDGGFTQTVSQLTADFKFVGFSNSKDVTVAVTLPDGQVEKFILGFTGLATNAANPAPLQTTKLFFKPLPGTTTQLEALADNIVNVVPSAFGPVEFRDRATGDLYNPTRFKLTLSNGSFFILNTVAGIESITDANGNALTFTPDAITHTDGRGLVMTRDAKNRITSIVDPAGATTTYGYDFYGDLVTVTDTLGNVTRFTYDSNHRLLEVFDALGRMGQRNEYDDTGRMIATIDGAGHRIEYTHDLAAKQEVVEDRRGAKTVTNYNENGFITSIVDALGGVTRFAVDAVGNVLAETDALGNVTLFSYDDQNRMQSRTDPIGNTTAWTYNSRGDVTSVTDPNGNVFKNEYDSRGNLTKMIDTLGNETKFTYNSAGLPTVVTDAMGGVTQFAYDARGNMTAMTNALGNVTTYTYSARGQQLTKTVTRTDENGNPRTMTLATTYDAMGRATNIFDVFGQSAKMEYNAVGQVTAREARNGERGEYEYDVRGRIVRSSYDDGTFDSWIYDANGNLSKYTNRYGQTTTHEYDALGRQILTGNGSGAFSSTDYDALGRVIASVNAAGDQVAYEYDSGGRFATAPRVLSILKDSPRVSAFTDAEGRRIEYDYDPNGNVSQILTNEGEVIVPLFDAMNRQTGLVLPGGITSQQAYDALGRITSVESGDGLGMSNVLDAIGQLKGVTDDAGNTIGYDYDEIGNRTSTTDANGNTTQWAYDDAGRVIRRTLPMGMSESWTYNTQDLPATHTDFNGDTTTFIYDAERRLLSKTYDDGTAVVYTYNAQSQIETVTDSRGVTSYFYDVSKRLQRYVNPDGTQVLYAYNTSGRLESVTSLAGTTHYTYDGLGILDSVTDPDGRVTTWTDGQQSATQNLPNGAKQETTIDEHGRITSIIVREADGTIAQSFTYLHDDINHTRTITELGGRSTTYHYDSTGYLAQEVIIDPVSGNQTITYTYDDFGNRLTKTDNTGTTTYLYDDNDRLVSETSPAGLITYTYDNNGNLTVRNDNGQVTTHAYDFDDRLIRVDTAGGDVIEYAYDHDGRRVSRTLNGVVTNYLLNILPDNEQVLDEYDAGGNVIASYTYGLSRISQDRSGDVSFYHIDGQTSTRVLTDSTGNLTDTYNYDAFGNLLSSTGSTENPFRYVGESFDPQANLIHLRARDLDPRTGRFMQLDPAAGIMVLPISMNKYAYGNSDPTSYADPSGEIAGLLQGLQLVNTIFNLVGILAAAQGLATVTAGALNLYNNGALFTGFGFSSSAGASLGQVGQISVSNDTGLIIDLANLFGESNVGGITFFRGTAQNLNQAFKVTEGYSVGGVVNYSPTTRAVAALGILWGEAGHGTGISMDFNHAGPGASATASLGAGGFSLGFGVDIDPWQAAIGPAFSFSAGLPDLFSFGSANTVDNLAGFGSLFGAANAGTLFANAALGQLITDITIGSTGEFSFGGGYSYSWENTASRFVLDFVFPPNVPPSELFDYWILRQYWPDLLQQAGI